MSQSRIPITDEERPYLEALGAEVRALRLGSHPTAEERMLRQARGRVVRQPDQLRQVELANRSDLSAYQVGQIERGRRRTRRSTLQRIVAALVDEDLVEEVVDGLVEIAGPALAPESIHADRVARRRAARARRTRAQIQRMLHQLEALAAEVPGDNGARLVNMTERAREDVALADLEVEQADEAVAQLPPLTGRTAAIEELLRLRRVRISRLPARKLLEHLDRLDAAERAVAEAEPGRSDVELPPARSGTDREREEGFQDRA